MRLGLLSTVAVLGFTTASFAADLPSRRPPAPYVAVPVFTWTGFYIGGNVGGGNGGFRTTNFNGPAAGGGVVGVTRPGAFNNNSTGFTGGGQIGYNYQIGNFVIGVEADASYTDFSRTRLLGGGNSARDSLSYLGTVRGRVGYAWDRVLVYGTGGFAYGDAYHRETFAPGFAAVAAGGAAATGSRSNTETGWAAGGGVEWAIPTGSALSFLNFFNTSAVTIKAEYLHYDLGRRSYGLFTGAGAQPYTARVRTDGDIGRIGINYKF
jgi:outer membrane immunogenic protein